MKSNISNSFVFTTHIFPHLHQKLTVKIGSYTNDLSKVFQLKENKQYTFNRQRFLFETQGLQVCHIYLMNNWYLKTNLNIAGKLRWQTLIDTRTANANRYKNVSLLNLDIPILERKQTYIYLKKMPLFCIYSKLCH